MHQLPVVVRALRASLPAGPRRGFGLTLARRVAEEVFGIGLELESGDFTATLGDSQQRVTEPGTPCGFFGSALAELLRQLTPFDGAMEHVTCRGRGDPHCTWRAAAQRD